MPKATGREPMSPPRQTKAARARGFTPTCIEKKAIAVTPRTGTSAQAKPIATNPFLLNGSALLRNCCTGRAAKLSVSYCFVGRLWSFPVKVEQFLQLANRRRNFFGGYTAEAENESGSRL